MHEGIYSEDSIPVAWLYYSKFCTNSQTCVAFSLNIHIPAEKSALLAPLLSHTLQWKTELCSCTKVMLEVQQRFKTCTNKLPSLQPGSDKS